MCSQPTTVNLLNNCTCLQIIRGIQLRQCIKIHIPFHYVEVPISIGQFQPLLYLVTKVGPSFKSIIVNLLG